MTTRNAPPAPAVEAGDRVGASPLGGARFLVDQLLADLEAARRHVDQRLADAEELGVTLRDQLDEADEVRAMAVAHRQRLEARDLEDAFSRCSTIGAELAATGERARELSLRAAELTRTLENLRPVHRCLEDLAQSDGTPEVDGVARFRSASRQVFQIIEEERMRIARDMHDGPAQSMSNLVLQAEVLERLVTRDPALLLAELDALKLGARGALEETRRLIFDLRPMTLDDLGLLATLRRFVAEFGERSGITARLHVVGEERRLSTTQESAIFRIVQEALTNVRKHSRAGSVEVVLTYQPHRVSAVVKDDGDGFDVAATEARQGRTRNLGLISMRERADLERARLDIRSQIGRGTEVRLALDLQQGLPAAG